LRFSLIRDATTNSKTSTENFHQGDVKAKRSFLRGKWNLENQFGLKAKQLLYFNESRNNETVSGWTLVSDDV